MEEFSKGTRVTLRKVPEQLWDDALSVAHVARLSGRNPKYAVLKFLQQQHTISEHERQIDSIELAHRAAKPPANERALDWIRSIRRKLENPR